MFAITIRERSGQVYTFHFDKPEVLIGRVKGNDVILPKQNISKRHTLVRTHGKRFVVEDLGSTNGTYVNGHRIATAVEVGPEDKMYLGDFVMNFIDLSDMAGGAPPEVPGAGDLPELPGDAGAEVNMRATQHIGPPQPEDPDPTEFRNKPPQHQANETASPAFPPLDMPQDPLLADLPPVEPLDMPEELMDSEESAEDFLQRMTGPLDGLQYAMSSDAFKADFAMKAPDEPAKHGAVSSSAKESALSSIPGLAGAIKAPSQPKPASTPDFAVAESAPAPSRAPDPVAKPAKANAISRPSIPMSQALHGDLRTSDSHHTGTQPDAYYEALATLFRGAVRDLRPSLPSDSSQMSESDWTEMEERVGGFVDAATHAGEVPADTDGEALRRDLIYELAGLGPLETLLDDPEIEAIEINGPTQIFAVRRGTREPAESRFSCQQALALAVDRLVRATGQTGRSGAHLEGTLVDGTSVYVVWPPVCPAGPAVVLRKPRGDAPDLAALVGRGLVTDAAAEVLALLVQARRSVAIVGPVGVGKRTVLNAVAQGLHPLSRIVVLEDGQRLRLHHEQVIRLDAAVFGEGSPSALRVTQRLRPDCLLLGDTAAIGLEELFGVGSDSLPPWVGMFVARDAADFIERATHALLLRHPGLAESVAQARVLRSLDAIAVFGMGPEGAVLSQVCEVRRSAAGIELVELSAQSMLAGNQ